MNERANNFYAVKNLYLNYIINHLNYFDSDESYEQNEIVFECTIWELEKYFEHITVKFTNLSTINIFNDHVSF